MPDIIDCKLKKYCQILVVFSVVFLTHLAIKWFKFPSHRKSDVALPWECRTSEVCVEI